MKKSVACVLLMIDFLAADSAFAQEGFRPSPQQAAAIGSMCQGWRPIARGVYMLKTSGQPKPKANSALHAQIIEEIYSPRTSVASEGMAEAAGEQFCIPLMKEKFRTGELRVK